MARIILASASPRRIELLTQARLAFETRSPQVNEARKPKESPRAMVARLAQEKARAIAETLLRKGSGGSPVLVIAADTTVVAPNGKTVLGKPETPAQAIRMVSSLAGKTHTVLTGYCILKPGGRQIVRVVTTKVTMRPLTRKQIEQYVASGESMDKAGAYAAQGYGMTLIESIRGSYTNVVGLPMAQLMGDLEAFPAPALAVAAPEARGVRVFSQK